MPGNSSCSVYIGNLDERVSDRVLYEILIQAGRVVDLYIPRDKETDKPKGFAFVEYENEDVADYAVRLFSGLVTLYNRTLKFAISGQDKASQNPPSAATPATSRQYHGVVNHMEISQQLKRSSTPSRIPDYPARYTQVLSPPGVSHQSNGYRSLFNDTNYEYSRRVFGSTLDSINRRRSRRYGTSDPISYPSY
ncbi:mannan endo-1,4-beta-mannosidase 5 [Hibiscus syriacus]|uniref:Mannan endo-1,4-beta-mannosidase 5 n=1 Tax=Hibiscus syriacus TaxID=106335 RepID=A0A6A3C8G1_HIBSY|nr:RNA-binding protein 7-like [Hibiscus syriacus]KAE8725413.1 mannan endo-1,4-beta-mannosidase 5 [Hibiscus syriacus]